MLSVLVELFGGSYYVTARNYLCKDKGKVPIEDIQDCKEAAKIIQDVRFYRVENSQRFPTGCYVRGEVVYFNAHANGSRDESSGSICRAIGKQLYQQSSHKSSDCSGLLPTKLG